MSISIKDDSLNIVWYACEVAGRVKGVASMTALVPDPEKKALLEAVAARILASGRTLCETTFAGTMFQYVDQRYRVGVGRGTDRGWEAGVASIADRGRVSLPDRSTSNPDYREVFTDGTTAPYTKPTIKQDPEVAAELRGRLVSSKLPSRDAYVAEIDEMVPAIAAAAEQVVTGERQVNDQFLVEINARKNVVDTLWQEKRTVEQLLGRAGRATTRFIFFDYRPRTATGGDDAPAPAEGGEPGEATDKAR